MANEPYMSYLQHLPSVVYNPVYKQVFGPISYPTYVGRNPAPVGNSWELENTLNKCKQLVTRVKTM